MKRLFFGSFGNINSLQALANTASGSASVGIPIPEKYPPAFVLKPEKKKTRMAFRSRGSTIDSIKKPISYHDVDMPYLKPMRGEDYLEQLKKKRRGL